MTAPSPSNAIQHVPRSGIRRVFDEASKYPDCIRLEVGEPSFPTPAHVKQAAVEALAADFTRYTPNAGIGDLREALVDKLARVNGITTTADDIIITNGAVAAIFGRVLALRRNCPARRDLVGWSMRSRAPASRTSSGDAGRSERSAGR